MGLRLDSEFDPLSTVPFNIREAAMLELARRNYDTAELDDIVKNLSPRDGSTWSREAKDKYHSEMFRLRKNIKAVSKSLGIDFISAMTYYLGSFKKSKDYRIVKQVRVEEKVLKIESTGHMVDKCGICGEGGSLLICDECEGEYHLACLKPPLSAVPEGRWECDECVDQKLIIARDSILCSTPLYEKIFVSGQTTENENNVTSPSNAQSALSLYKPTAKVLEDLRHFVHEVNHAVAQKKTDTKIVLAHH
jgi:PHD-finger